MLCPKCLNPNVRKNGFAIAQFGKHQRYFCPVCGLHFMGNRGGKGRIIRYESSLKPDITSAAKVNEKLHDRFFDIDVTTEVDYDT